ncbi:MAG: RNA-binding S4 domain-containing protein [Firmicutes bacterium]|nr:RNA-binding S4 domain-containing protein [Bacillota bacterium]
MRLDKYLKTARLFKRRAVAREVLREGLVTVNGRLAKPSTTVRPGDVVTIKLGPRTISFEVIAINEHVTAEEAPTLYKMLTE